MRAMLYNTLTGAILDGDVALVVKSFVETHNAPAEVVAELLRDDYFSLVPAPFKTGLALYDDDNRCVFHGFLTRATYSLQNAVVSVEAVSWLGWLRYHSEVDECAFKDTDAGYILAALWCRSCSPLSTAPAMFTYEAVETGMLMGTFNKPVRSAWYLATSYDRLAQSIANDAGVVHTERIVERFDGMPFTYITAMHNPTVAVSHATFAVGHNITGDILFDIKAESSATDVLVLGEGEGPDRQRATGLAYSPDTPRTVTVVEVPELLTEEAATAKAHSIANSSATELPFDTMVVMKNSAFAPYGSYAPGQLITIDLADFGGRITDAQLVAIDWGSEDDSTATLTVRKVRR